MGTPRRVARRAALGGLLAAAIAVPATQTLLHPKAAPTSAPMQATSAASAASASPWGVATSHGSAQHPARWLATLAASGATALRGFDERGHLATVATDRGMAVVAPLVWSSGHGAQTFPVDDLAGWQSYVERTVRAQPKVRQWEIWNEPPNFTLDTSPASYARIVQAAYTAIKKVDATLQVGLAAKATYLSFLADAIDAGAAGHYDFVTLHPYERVGQLFDGWDENFYRVAGQARAMLAVHDPARRGVPIDFTELGSPAADLTGPDRGAHMTAQDQADVLVKAYTLAIAQGIRRAYWYDAWDGDAPSGERPYGLIAEDGTPRPAYKALKNLITSLGVRPQLTAVRTIGPAATIVEFATRRGPVLVAWSQEGAALRFERATAALTATGRGLPAARTVQLSGSPLVIPTFGGAYTWTPRRPATPAAAARAYDVAWSAGSGSRGLLVRGGTPAVVGGRAVRDMSTSSSLDMAVVPPAPTWTRARIQVQVTVRGTGAAAGFGLRYEPGPDVPGVDGIGEAGAPVWRHLPVGVWRTYTWNVPSARLEGVFGVNLRLNSDSRLHSRYVVSDVRVHVEEAP